MVVNPEGIKLDVKPLIDNSRANIGQASSIISSLAIPSSFTSSGVLRPRVINNIATIDQQLYNINNWVNSRIDGIKTVEAKNRQLFENNSFLNNNLLSLETRSLARSNVARVDNNLEKNKAEEKKGLLALTGAYISKGFGAIGSIIKLEVKAAGSYISNGCKSILSDLSDWGQDKIYDFKKWWNNGKIVEVQIKSLSYLDKLSSENQAAAQNSMDTFYNNGLMENKKIYDH